MVSRQHKLTVLLPDDLHREFKLACARHQTTLAREIRNFIKLRTLQLNQEGGSISPLDINRMLRNLKAISASLEEEISEIDSKDILPPPNPN